MTQRLDFAILGLKIILILTIGLSQGNAREIHVSKSGDDTNNGSISAPYLTINKAAQVAQPGDLITVHEGVYRERVTPIHGGTSEIQRIIYRAAKKGEVWVKGSEVIDSWVKNSQGMWEVRLHNSFFGEYNPYALNVDGDYQLYGQWHHRGDVYINNEALWEKQTSVEVTQEENTWYTTVQGDSTIIIANFGSQNPNQELTEINARELIFFPEKAGLAYITIDGFNFLHAAPNWVAPNDGQDTDLVQVGAVGSNMGNKWIIENCLVSYSRTAGIMIGESPELQSQWQNIDAFGDCIVRNNIITRCGEFGIAGQKKASRALIIGNLIEDINYRDEFSGHETAAIKIWNCTDATIENNLIRRVNGRKTVAGKGIWIDFGNQGTRITRNIIYETVFHAIRLEANHGPSLVDNNIIFGDRVNMGFGSESGGTIIAHNLFVNTACAFTIQEKNKIRRTAHYVVPHTLKKAGYKRVLNIQNKVYNNIFIGPPKHKEIKHAPQDGNIISHNLYIDGAEERPGIDKNSITSKFKTSLVITSLTNNATLTFNMDDSPMQIKAPLITSELIGVIPIPKQKMEDRYAQLITINKDFFNRPRNTSAPRIGPFANLKQGLNSYNLFDGQVSMKPHAEKKHKPLIPFYCASHNDQFSVFINKEIATFSIAIFKLFDLKGRQVFSVRETNLQSFQLPAFSRGLYIGTLIVHNRAYTRKMNLERNPQ